PGRLKAGFRCVHRLSEPHTVPSLQGRETVLTKRCVQRRFTGVTRGRMHIRPTEGPGVSLPARGLEPAACRAPCRRSLNRLGTRAAQTTRGGCSMSQPPSEIPARTRSEVRHPVAHQTPHLVK